MYIHSNLLNTCSYKLHFTIDRRQFDRSEMGSHSDRRFTGEELGRLNQRHNAHIAYAGKVYDASGFLAKHPGGCDQLMLGAGRDITQLFQSYHKPGTAKLIGEKCKYVGELVDNEMPTFPPTEGEFFCTLHSRVMDYFKSNNLDPKVNVFAFFRYTTFAVLSILFWCLCIVLCQSSWQFTASLAAAASGFFAILVGFTLYHEGNHFAITHKPWVWRASTFVSDCIFGISSLTWMYQHTYGHHIFTNIDGSDPDIKTINDGLDFWRLKPFQHWFPIYRFQHIYMPILYSITLIKGKLQDFHSILIMKKGSIRINQLGTYQLISFIAPKVIFFSFRLVLPYLFVPLSSILLMNLVAETTIGILFTPILIQNHVNAEAFSSSPTAKNSGDSLKKDQTTIKQNWAEMQIATTVDYATESWFLTVFTGAMNHQVAHHLFPGVLQIYYPQITPIVKRTCAEFGLRYNEVPSFWDALRYHLGYLKVMGTAPKSQTK